MGHSRTVGLSLLCGERGRTVETKQRHKTVSQRTVRLKTLLQATCRMSHIIAVTSATCVLILPNPPDWAQRVCLCVCVCVSGKRQTAALQLLESERVYVSYLSLLLKANISFNGSEVLHAKDKRYYTKTDKQTHRFVISIIYMGHKGVQHNFPV